MHLQASVQPVCFLLFAPNTKAFYDDNNINLVNISKGRFARIKQQTSGCLFELFVQIALTVVRAT